MQSLQAPQSREALFLSDNYKERFDGWHSLGRTLNNPFLISISFQFWSYLIIITMQSKTTFLKTIWAIFAKPIWDWSMIERAKIILLFEMQLWFKIERGFYCLLWLSHTLTQAFYFQDWQVLSQGFPHTLHNIQYYLLACLPPIEDSRLEDSRRLCCSRIIGWGR